MHSRLILVLKVLAPGVELYTTFRNQNFCFEDMNNLNSEKRIKSDGFGDGEER